MNISDNIKPIIFDLLKQVNEIHKLMRKWYN